MDEIIVKKMPAGLTDFRKISETGCYYVDKTDYAAKLMRNGAVSIQFTRPHHFGKTVFLSMISRFFDIREDSKDIFSGLSIMKDKEAIENWMNKFPVIYLSFKDVVGKDFKEAVWRLGRTMQKLFSEFQYIRSEGSPVDRKLFEAILEGTASLTDIWCSLYTLEGLLYSHYGKKVILLIDECDAPLLSASLNGYYSDMLSFLDGMLCTVLKDCPFTAKGVIIGCLRIPNDSIIYGLDNLYFCSLTDYEYADAFGFTESELQKMLAETSLESKAMIFRKRFGGYKIGDNYIYRTGDVISYANKLLLNDDISENSFKGQNLVKHILDVAKYKVSDDFSVLINGGTVRKRIIETITYIDCYSYPANIWSLLVMKGYLTLAGTYHPNDETEVRLPNEEMRQLFASAVDESFSDAFKENIRVSAADNQD